MMNRVEINTILEHLPHRYPFILIDRIIENEEENRLVAIKNVTINEPYFVGHFPGRPIMPGVLVVEALAQACVLLANKILKEEPGKRFMHYFAGIDKARFKQMVIPGDQLRLEVEVLRRKRDIWQMHGKATVDGNLACSAELLSAMQVYDCDR